MTFWRHRSIQRILRSSVNHQALRRDGVGHGRDRHPCRVNKWSPLLNRCARDVKNSRSTADPDDLSCVLHDPSDVGRQESPQPNGAQPQAG